MSRNGVVVGAFAALAFAQTLAYFVYLRDDPGNYNGAGAQGEAEIRRIGARLRADTPRE